MSREQLAFIAGGLWIALALCGLAVALVVWS